MLIVSSTNGQGPAPQSDSPQKEDAKVAGTDTSKTGNSGNKVGTSASTPSDLEVDVAAMKADNAAVREQLRKMEEQQKTLLELVDSLKRRLDSPITTDTLASGTSTDPATTDGSLPAANTGNTSAQPAAVANKKATPDRYQDGIVIWQTPDDAEVPFLLKFNQNSQIRYLNTLSSPETFTDHLGVTREVRRRNDITVNRTMFILGGYIFDKRLRYSSTVWTSAGAASIVVAGNIGWTFNKALSITGGYNGVPGSRSLVNTFPFFTSTDRSMADNFFRPGFTQGIWANGEPVKGLNYMVFVGNGLNTINITANKIDTSLLLSGSVWWEPLGNYAEPGKSRNMYDDYFASKKTRIRLGTSFTRSREDRFTNLDQSSPENTALYNSDGVLTFSTGAFAPGVTVDKATYRMMAFDGGLKWNGLAVNGQYFFRRLDDFEADGPMPLTFTFDHGGELSASYFVIPKELMFYGRGSKVYGQFGNSYEYAGGLKWHFLPTERLWLNAELMRVHKVPYTGAFTPYNAGMSGWTPMVQTVLAF
jgi:hypothetical protein